ncbi:hypothetical protein ACQB60_44125 [Actinomycetota bacterium Odt1-20B]
MYVATAEATVTDVEMTAAVHVALDEAGLLATSVSGPATGSPAWG